MRPEFALPAAALLGMPDGDGMHQRAAGDSRRTPTAQSTPLAINMAGRWLLTLTSASATWPVPLVFAGGALGARSQLCKRFVLHCAWDTSQYFLGFGIMCPGRAHC